MISESKIKEWIDLYLDHIDNVTLEVHVRDEEGYKFKSVDMFQQNFNIDAPDLAAMLERSIVPNNLVAGRMYFPKRVLICFAQEYEKETREALRAFFDESGDAAKRINQAEKAFNDLLIKWNKEKESKMEHTFIGIRFLSLLLGFRYSDKYNAIKPREWRRFCKFIDNEFKFPKESTHGEEYEIYEKYIDALRNYIKTIPKIKEIRSLLIEKLGFKDNEYRWMAQDIIYIVSSKIVYTKKREVAEKDLTDFEEENPVIIKETMPILSKMTIEPKPLSFEKLLSDVKDGMIQVPPFQRDFVWSAREIADLLDSIYRGYPIGSFIFWKTTKRLEHHRSIGGSQLTEPLAGALIDYILDGQQRITSLYAAVRGAKIEDEKYQFYFDLSLWRFNYDKGEENPSSDDNDDKTKIFLEKLFVRPAEFHLYVSSYSTEHHEILTNLYNRFSDYPFPVIYVQSENELENKDDRQDIKQIVKIFTKINETGRKLTVVAKMIARCWAEDFDLRKKLNDLFESDERLFEIREETILQIASTILNNKKSKSRNILQDTNIRQLEVSWDDVMEAFWRALDFLRNNLRIKNLKFIPFDSVLVPLSYFYYKENNPSAEQITQLERWFWKACLSNRFGATAEAKCEEDCNSFDLILDHETADFDYPIDWDTFKLRLIKQKYVLKNAFVKTVFSLYSYMQPKNLKDNSDIDLEKSFSAYNKSNFHHFFPRAYLERSKDSQKDLMDSVVNIAFAPNILNREMEDQDPSEYIQNFQEENTEITKSLETHLIGNLDRFGIDTNNFNIFLEKRAEKIENEFRSLLGLRTKTEEQFEKQPTAPVDLFELRMRNLLDSYLQKEYGENYWEEAIPIEIRENVDLRVQDDLRLNPYNEPMYIKCRERLNFMNIIDYLKIIQRHWLIFQNVFVSKGEFKKHIIALNDYRNTIRHSREVDPVIKRNGEAAILWFEKVFDFSEENN